MFHLPLWLFGALQLLLGLGGYLGYSYPYANFGLSSRRPRDTRTLKLCTPTPHPPAKAPTETSWIPHRLIGPSTRFSQARSGGGDGWGLGRVKPAAGGM